MFLTLDLLLVVIFGETENFCRRVLDGEVESLEQPGGTSSLATPHPILCFLAYHDVNCLPMPRLLCVDRSNPLEAVSQNTPSFLKFVGHFVTAMEKLPFTIKPQVMTGF